jgi:hypothetical protein
MKKKYTEGKDYKGNRATSSNSGGGKSRTKRKAKANDHVPKKMVMWIKNGKRRFISEEELAALQPEDKEEQ